MLAPPRPDADEVDPALADDAVLELALALAPDAPAALAFVLTAADVDAPFAAVPVEVALPLTPARVEEAATVPLLLATTGWTGGQLAVRG